jgi:hypothetical protein
VSIGTVNGTGSGTISAVVPNSPGNGFRVRVVSTSPVLVAADNGVDLTIHPLPNASFTLSPTIVLDDGSKVTFSPSSTSEAAYAWDLGQGAVPPTSTAVQPQASYTLPGPKTISLTVTAATGCTATKQIDTLPFEVIPLLPGLVVYSCTPKIPSGAEVIKGSASNATAQAVWICPGATLSTGGGGHTVFVEPGGTFNFSGGGGYVTHVRSLGSYAGSSGGMSLVISEPGASLTGSYTSLKCAQLKFDYAAAPANGCP